MSGNESDLMAERVVEAKRWLKIAVDDRDVAQLCLDADEPKLGGGAYHCQQVAEKLMKGLLVLTDDPFPKAHALQALGVAVRGRYPHCADLIDATLAWTTWGFVYRYSGPEDYDEPAPEELPRAIGVIDRHVTEVKVALFGDGAA